VSIKHTNTIQELVIQFRWLAETCSSIDAEANIEPLRFRRPRVYGVQLTNFRKDSRVIQQTPKDKHN
jgi:hypothetical protein